MIFKRFIFKFLKQITVLAFIFQYILPVTASAQEVEVPLSISINNVSHSGDNVEIDISIKNNTDIFASDLQFIAELFMGDKLADYGFLFAGLTHEYTGQGEIQTIEPGETINTKLSFEVPSTLKSGNYFVKLMISNENQSFFGANHTKEPFKIEGTGEYMGSLYGQVFYEDEYYGLTEGPAQDKEDGFTFVLPSDHPANTELFENIDSGLIADIKVYDVFNQNNLVAEYPNVDADVNQSRVRFDVSNFEDIKPGSYTVVADFKNSNGENIANSFYMRWFVGGLSARISSIITETNYYRKGDIADLEVGVIAGGYEDGEIISIRATLIPDDSSVQPIVFNKDVSLVSEDDSEYQGLLAEEVGEDFDGQVEGQAQEVFVDFIDQKIDYKGYIKEVVVEVLDSDGNVLSTDKLEVDLDNKYTKNNNYFLYLIAVVTVLIIVTLVLIWRRKQQEGGDINNIVASLILLTGILVSSIFLNNDIKVANANHTVSTNVYIWSDLSGATTLPSGDLGICSQDRNIAVYFKLSCAHCLNKVDSRLSFFNEYETGESYWNWDNAVFIDVDGRITVDGQDDGLAQDRQVYNNPITGIGSNQHTYGPYGFNLNVSDQDNSPNGTVINQTYLLRGIAYKGAGGGYCGWGERNVSRTVSCTVQKDVCLNLDGEQATVPSGYTQVGNQCDFCPNLPDIQNDLPAGHVKDVNGNCIPEYVPPKDACENIDGIQSDPPDGYTQVGKQCDFCPDVTGIQDENDGFIKDSNGNCQAPSGEIVASCYIDGGARFSVYPTEVPANYGTLGFQGNVYGENLTNLQASWTGAVNDPDVIPESGLVEYVLSASDIGKNLSATFTASADGYDSKNATCSVDVVECLIDSDCTYDPNKPICENKQCIAEDLEVSCRVNTTKLGNINGGTFRWTANATGGVPPYTYDWSGLVNKQNISSNLSNNVSYSVSPNHPQGSYRQFIELRDSNGQTTGINSCPVVVVQQCTSNNQCDPGYKCIEGSCTPDTTPPTISVTVNPKIVNKGSKCGVTVQATQTARCTISVYNYENINNNDLLSGGSTVIDYLNADPATNVVNITSQLDPGTYSVECYDVGNSIATYYENNPVICTENLDIKEI